MRAVTALSALLSLQLGLALLLATRHDPLAGPKLDTPLVPASAVKRTDALIIESKETSPAAAASGAATVQVELQKKDGQWVLPAQYDAPADSNRVSMLLDRLSALRRGLPIATSPASLKRFKVTDGDFERRVQLKAGGTVLDTLYVGTSPGLRKSDARTDADRAVYAVDLMSYELPADPGAWLNAELLRQDAEALSELDVGATPADRVQLRRQPAAGAHSTTWVDPALSGNAHIDIAHADALVTLLSQVHLEKVLGIEARPEWQQDRPALSLELKGDKLKAVQWTLSKPVSGDDYVLKSSAHPWFFAISAAQAKAIIDAGSREQLIAGGVNSPRSGRSATGR